MKEKSFAIFRSKNFLQETKNYLKIDFKMKNQKKIPDVLIKFKKQFFIVEAKHLNTSGGTQDKQLKELIELIGLFEKSKNISYVSFSDGHYSNVLLNFNPKNISGRDKVREQRKEIVENLKKNPQNFWLNTSGFEKLIEDFQTKF